MDGLPDVVNESLNDRQHILIFLPTVAASIEATQILSDAGIKTSCVLGITSAGSASKPSVISKTAKSECW